MKQERIAYFQWLRFFAAAAVVLMHTAANKWMSISFQTEQWEILNVYDSLVRWPVPIFIMISGAIFLPRRTELRDVLKTYIPRLAIAYGFWCGVYTFAAWRMGTPARELPLKFLQGHYHLWYIPFLWGIYLAVPFLQRIVREERLADQLLAVSYVVGLLIPWLADLLVLVFPEGSQHVRTVEGDLSFAFFMDHLFFLVLGHRLHQRELTPGQRRLIYAAGILSVALTAAATRWSSSLAGIQNSLFYDSTAPGNVCAAAALFVFAKYHLHTLPRAVGSLAQASFGVYLMHPLIIESLSAHGIHVLAFDPWLSVPVLSVGILGVCWLASWLLARIPVVGKYLV